MGAFATPWWGQVAGLADGRDHRRAQRQARARPDRRVGRAGGRVGPGRRAGARCRWLVGAVLVRRGRRRSRRCWPGSRSSPGPPVAGLDAARRASSSTGSRRSGPARWRRSAWPWSTTRPTPRSSTAPSAWRRPGRPELVLLHVVDTPMTRVYGAETADRETGADARYLAEVVRVAAGRGLSRPPGPAPRPRPRRPARRPPAARPGRPAGRRLARPRPGPRPALRPDRGQGPARPGIPMLIARPGRTPGSDCSGIAGGRPGTGARGSGWPRRVRTLIPGPAACRILRQYRDGHASATCPGSIRGLTSNGEWP